MMAQPFHAPGMAPGHPGIPHGHPMAAMQHPGHMGGQPGPNMMQGMHPGVSGPQVTQGPMVTGMPPGAGTPAPGGPMHNNPMAMAHLGPQQAMFQQQVPHMQQFNPQQQQQLLARQRMMQMSQQQHGNMGMPMAMQNFNPAQIQAQMKMGMPQMQNLQQMQQHPQAQHFQQQQQQRQMAAMAAHQQAFAQQQQNQQRVAAAQAQVQAQQMSLSRSQEPTSQPPQPHPTPAPQSAPQPPPTPQPTAPPQQQPAQPKPQPQSANTPQGQQSQQATPQQAQPSSQANQKVKVDDQEQEPQIKQQDAMDAMMMQEMPKPEGFSGQCVLQLLLYQDSLASPERPHDLRFWEEIIQRFFSPFGSMRQQLYDNARNADKAFQLTYPSLARFYHAHFASGIKQILMHSFDHTQNKLPNGGVHIWSQTASLTYVFHNDIRITTQGQLRVSFDDMNRIEHLNISTSGWTEYIPRHALEAAFSPDQKQQSPKMNKNAKRAQQQQQQQKGTSSSPIVPSAGVSSFGLPMSIIQFLEIAEVMTTMGSLMEYYHLHPGISPRESLHRFNAEGMQVQNNLRNQMAMTANGQIQMMKNPTMNGPNQFQSPALAHLGLPQQGSPHPVGAVHTPSPAQNPTVGGVAMMHQMSAQGSNLSGSQGPSTNTSPNVSNKRRRPSAIKLEEENQSQENNQNKVKPSPRIGGKRQKAAA